MRLTLKRIQLVALAFFLLASTLGAASAGSDSILGKWQVNAETPDGPLSVEFNFREQNGVVTGSAQVPEGSFPMSGVKFDGTNFAADLTIEGDVYKLTATMREGKLVGAFERTDGAVRGTWAGERVSDRPSGAGISGTWDSVASTPQGDLQATLEIQQNGESVSGQLNFPEGSVPLQAGTFRESRLQFDVELGSSRYRTQATITGERMDGAWNAVYGDESGAFRATRRSTGGGTQLLGNWLATAITPMGDMTFELEVKEANGTLSGTIATPEGSLPVQNPSIADNKLSFEVEYMGGRYRLELAPEGDKLRGTWGAVGGGETGPLSAERK
jgi:hypothetical protein